MQVANDWCNAQLVSTSDNQCDVGFTTPEQLQLAQDVIIPGRQLRVIKPGPLVKFTCDGEISNWTMAAIRIEGGGRNQYPQFQIWRPSSNLTDTYIRANTTFNMSTTVSTYIHSGVFDPPLRFVAGDIPGVYIPRLNSNILRMFVLNGFGPFNYYVFDQLDSGVSMLQTNRRFSVNAVPLISLGVGNCVCVCVCVHRRCDMVT